MLLNTLIDSYNLYFFNKPELNPQLMQTYHELLQVDTLPGDQKSSFMRITRMFVNAFSWVIPKLDASLFKTHYEQTFVEPSERTVLNNETEFNMKVRRYFYGVGAQSVKSAQSLLEGYHSKVKAGIQLKEKERNHILLIYLWLFMSCLFVFELGSMLDVKSGDVFKKEYKDLFLSPAQLTPFFDLTSIVFEGPSTFSMGIKEISSRGGAKAPKNETDSILAYTRLILLAFV